MTTNNDTCPKCLRPVWPSGDLKQHGFDYCWHQGGRECEGYAAGRDSCRAEIVSLRADLARITERAELAESSLAKARAACDLCVEQVAEGRRALYEKRADLAEMTERAERAERERDAYKRSKAENDDRFMRERDEARDTIVDRFVEVVELRARIVALEAAMPSEVERELIAWAFKWADAGTDEMDVFRAWVERLDAVCARTEVE